MAGQYPSRIQMQKSLTKEIQQYAKRVYIHHN